MFFKLFIECIKEARQTKKDLRKIRNFEVCMESLQRIVNEVSLGHFPVEIEIELLDGGKIKIKKEDTTQLNVETFADRYYKAKSGRTK